MIGTEPMNLRYIFLLCLWISFLGCGHFSQNQSLLQEDRGQTNASTPTAFIKHTPSANVNSSHRAHTNAYGFKDSNLEDKELESTEPNAAIVFGDSENSAQKNTV